MKKVCIIQSSYIPWKGYFDLINSVDECIIYDDVQFTKRDWRTRNTIRTPNGLQWLTIPVFSKGMYYQKIQDVKVVDSKWCIKHWNAIRHNYAQAPYFTEYSKNLQKLYEQIQPLVSLSEINHFLIKAICKLLDIKTLITNSNSYGFTELNKTDRLAAICKAAKATYYLSGPSARNYIEESKFKEANIELEYISYNDYPEYSQCFPNFIPNVSVLDLILCTGPNWKSYMKSFKLDFSEKLLFEDSQ